MTPADGPARKARGKWRIPLIIVSVALVLAIASIVIAGARDWTRFLDAIATASQRTQLQTVRAPRGSVVMYQGDTVATVQNIIGIRGAEVTFDNHRPDSIMVYVGRFLDPESAQRVERDTTVVGQMPRVSDWQLPLIVHLVSGRIICSSEQPHSYLNFPALTRSIPVYDGTMRC